MGKVLAIIFLVVFAWYAVPFFSRGIWIAPTEYPDYWWGEHIFEYSPQVAQDGYGWFDFDPRTAADGGQTTAQAYRSVQGR